MTIQASQSEKKSGKKSGTTHSQAAKTHNQNEPHQSAMLAQAVQLDVQAYHERLRGRRVWLACSGGRDSLALAEVCHQLYQQGQLPFLPQLLHIDHGLQAQSVRWGEQVAEWAATRQMPCQVIRVTVAGNLNDDHDADAMASEAAAREARYVAMMAVMRQEDVLMLAHHADDQAETVLMRLFKGAGVKGLSGMQPWRKKMVGKQSIYLWRPWLNLSRAVISEYVVKEKLPYVDDPTNMTGSNTRSWLRREVMPVLLSQNPSVIDNIGRSAQLLAEAEQRLAAQTLKDLQHCVVNETALQSVLDVHALQSLPIDRQRALLHRWLQGEWQSTPSGLPPDKQTTDRLLALAQRQENNHQTQILWNQNRQPSAHLNEQQGSSLITVRRYRQRLYRMTEAWRHWLSLPLFGSSVLKLESSAVASFGDDADNHVSDEAILKKVGLKNESVVIELKRQKAYVQPLAILLRQSEDICWYLQLSSEVLVLLVSLDCAAGHVTLHLQALSRNMRLAKAGNPIKQSGKKLYQSFAIPEWQRDSVVVLAVNEKAVLLITPDAGHWLDSPLYEQAVESGLGSLRIHHEMKQTDMPDTEVQIAELKKDDRTGGAATHNGAVNANAKWQLVTRLELG